MQTITLYKRASIFPDEGEVWSVFPVSNADGVEYAIPEGYILCESSIGQPVIRFSADHPLSHCTFDIDTTRDGQPVICNFLWGEYGPLLKPAKRQGEDIDASSL